MSKDLWWMHGIKEDDIYEFFVESSDITKNIIGKIPSIAQSKFNHYYANLNGNVFMPEGVIVSHSKTEWASDNLRCISRGMYAPHFIICKRRSYQNRGKLSKDIPCTILMPMGNILNNATPHSGYLSKNTWGIELRNIGILRPQKKQYMQSTPLPLYPNENQTKDFKVDKDSKVGDYHFYTSLNEWREYYDNSRYQLRKDGTFVYECPTYDQIITLCALIRMLNKITPLNRNLIIPSNCVNINDGLALRSIDWENIRKYSIDQTGPIEFQNKSNLSTIHAQSQYNDLIISDTNEIEISNIIDRHKWKTNADEGEYSFLENDNILELVFSNVKNKNYEMKTINDMLVYFGFPGVNLNETSKKSYKFEKEEDLEKLSYSIKLFYNSLPQNKRPIILSEILRVIKEMFYKVKYEYNMKRGEK